MIQVFRQFGDTVYVSAKSRGDWSRCGDRRELQNIIREFCNVVKFVRV